MAPIDVIFFIECDVVVSSNDYLFLQFKFEGGGGTDKTRRRLNYDKPMTKLRQEENTTQARQDKTCRADRTNGRPDTKTRTIKTRRDETGIVERQKRALDVQKTNKFCTL